MKIVVFFSIYALTIIFGLTFSGCEELNNNALSKNDSDKCFTTFYRIRNSPIKSISTDWSINLNVNHLNENLSVLCEFSYSKNEFSFVDLHKDDLIKIVKFPKKINKIGSICIDDTSNFAFITDTTFYLYRNGFFQRIDYGVFKDGYIPLNYINIIYKPKENQLISGVLTYTNRKADELDYSSYFLNIYDLKSMKSSLIPFSYPRQFHGNKLGIPKVYLSEFDNNLLVSFELDDNVYKIDLKTKKVDTIVCKSSMSNISEAFFPVSGNKQSKIDAIQKNDLNVGGYGMAFINGNKIYRLFRPGLPIRDLKGNYFNSTDRGANIIELDLSNNVTKEIQLANGQYYVPTFWSLNRFSDCLVYPKIEEHVSKKNLCFYNIHSVSIYN